MSKLEIQIVGRVGGSLGSEIRRRLRAPWLFSALQCIVLGAFESTQWRKSTNEGTWMFSSPEPTNALGAHWALHLKAHRSVREILSSWLFGFYSKIEGWQCWLQTPIPG